MCGIFGVLPHNDNYQLDESRILEMSRIIDHRGPDDNGVYCNGHIGLAHYRLSIIDLSGGHQPMSNEDGSLWIVYNGEIYNHLELRRDLERAGHRYRTKSDTETILHAYEEYGHEAVNRLQGMFAFAIWDAGRKQLFCARDRMGIKPFYYYADNDKFIFASEIKAIVEDAGISRELCVDSLPEYLFFGYPTGGRTMYEGINALMPGHTLTVSGAGMKINQYWDVPESASETGRSEESYVQELDTLLQETVSSHLMSDVPLGVFLSGGLDSSLIAAMASRKTGRGLNTFSVGYDNRQHSELPFAERVSEHVGTHHHDLVISSDDFAENLPRLIWHEDEPIVFSSSVPLYLISKMAKEHVTVVLSGEGSDEIFAGYPKYAYTMLNYRMGRVYETLVPGALRRNIFRPLAKSIPLPLKFRKKLQHTFLFFDATIEDLYINNFFPGIRPEEQGSVLSEGMRERISGISSVRGLLEYYNQCPSEDFLSRMLYVDQKSYLLELLMRQDAMSMATSVESRVPFLDHKLIEYAATIPAGMKLSGTNGKKILKRVAEKYLPKDIIYRKKMGFPTPLAAWFRNEFKGKVEELLLGGRTRERGMFDCAYISTMLRRNYEGQIDWTEQIWRLVNLELWLRIYIDGESDVRF